AEIAVLARGGQQFAVGAEGDAEDAVARPLLPPDQSARGVVDCHLAVIGDAEAAAAAGEPLAVGAEGHAPDAGPRAAQAVEQSTTFQVPALQFAADQFLVAAAAAGGGQAPAVGAEGDGPHGVAVAAEALALGPRCGVPELDGVVEASRGDGVAV